MAKITLQDLQDLVIQVLNNSKTSPDNAASVASAIVRAEADGISSHGVARLPTYADQSMCYKVNGFAEPVLSKVYEIVGFSKV